MGYESAAPAALISSSIGKATQFNNLQIITCL